MLNSMERMLFQLWLNNLRDMVAGGDTEEALKRIDAAIAATFEKSPELPEEGEG